MITKSVQIMFKYFNIVFLSSVYQYSRESSLHKMKELQKDLEFFLKRNQLTGLYNRRGYYDNRDKLKSSYDAILMCDIDHFKEVNDTHGHYAGDFAILEVAKCIQKNIRKKDVAVRWGGEEFLIFLSKTAVDDAYIVAEKLRESIENLSIAYTNDIVVNLTLSIGVSTLDDDILLEDAIKNADLAMYSSKASGRNKTSRY